MKTPLTKKRLQQHFTYSWWKYALLVSVGILFWNIFFSVTTPQTPQEYRVTTYIYAVGDQEGLNAYLENVRTTEMADMQQVDTIFTYPDPTNGPMVLMAHIAAGEGDLYIFDKETYQAYASQSLFLPLEDWLAERDYGFENVPGTDMERAWRKDSESGERHIYGVPLKFLPGMGQYLYDNLSSYYISVAANSGNEENCFKLLEILIRDMQQAPAAQ